VLLTERPRAHHKTIISLFPSVHRQTETEMFLILRSVTWCLVAATSDLETSGCFFCGCCWCVAFPSVGDNVG